MEGGWAKYVESIDNRLARLEDAVNGRLKEVETDVASLKETRAKSLGVMAATSFVGGVAIQVVMTYVATLFK